MFGIRIVLPNEVFLGNGDGTFSFAGPVFDKTLDRPAAWGDFDGDGRLDLRIVHRDLDAGTPAVNALLFGLGDGEFAPQATFGVPGDVALRAQSDFNGDGRWNLVGTDEAIDGAVSMLVFPGQRRR